jgi:hypothetical protein
MFNVSKINLTFALFTALLFQPAVHALNVLDYGASGDCLHDDSQAINRVIRQLENSSEGASATHSGEVFFPKPPGGCYLVMKPIVLSGQGGTANYNFSISLVGEGRGVSVIRAGAKIDTVLLKDSIWNRGHTITDLTFDANGMASHAIHWERGTEGRFTRVEGLNGTVDDLALDQDGEDFVSDSFFFNSITFPPYNIHIKPRSTDNEFTNNIAWNAQIANIYEENGGTNHFVSNHAYGWPQKLCPKYSFITAFQSMWVANQSDCSTEAGFLVDGWSTNVTGNVIQGAQNHGICLSPKIGDATVVANQMFFQDANGNPTNPPASNAVVQGVMSGGDVSCTGPGVQNPVWGNSLNYGASNVVLSNSPTSNENLWNAFYTTTVNQIPLVGIDTTEPQANLDVNGDIRVGNSNATCDGTRAGAIRFDAGSHAFLGCDGTNWVSFAVSGQGH